LLQAADADFGACGTKAPMMETIGELFARHRQNCALRFTGPTDWLRLTLLGMLIVLSCRDRRSSRLGKTRPSRCRRCFPGGTGPVQEMDSVES
jgi:hypothetical protein